MFILMDSETKKEVHDAKARPHVPDLVVEQILRNLPAIPAVCLVFVSKRWEGLFLSYNPLKDLNFKEVVNTIDQDRHRKFINFLEGCLKYLGGKDERLLNRFRVHMTMYSDKDDANTVDRCLSFALERRVKELDISLRSSACGGTKYYSLWPQTLEAQTKFLTTLKLDYVTLLQFHTGWCPFIQRLSLSSCCFVNHLSVSSSSLKSLEVMHCSWKSEKAVHNNDENLPLIIAAANLESFKLVSNQDDPVQNIICTLMGCRKMRYLTIHAHYLRSLVIKNGCQDIVKATIYTPDQLEYFGFTGYLRSLSNVTVVAPNIVKASILLRNSAPTFYRSWEHFSTLRDFLEKFGSSANVTLCPHDVEALIFPEDFRISNFPPAMPGVKKIEVYRSFVSEGRDSDLRDSLAWMAPSASSLSIRNRDY